jgi:hypothetical protein
VLFSENHTLQPALLAAKTSQNGNPIASSTQVQLHVSAPAVAFMGETYKVSARIENKGPSPIVKMTGELIFNEWYNGVSPWAGPVSWSCFAEKPRVVSIWNIGAAPGFPIAPGATWEMEFELMMPLADCTLPKASGSNGTYLAIGEAKHGLPLPTSLHATQCPNIQFAYHLEFKVSTSLNDMPKGSFDLPFYFARRNLPGMLAPSAPEGPLKTLKMAPSQGPLCRSSASLAAAAKASSSNQPAEPNSESIPAVFEPSKISSSRDYGECIVPSWSHDGKRVPECGFGENDQISMQISNTSRKQKKQGESPFSEINGHFEVPHCQTQPSKQMKLGFTPTISDIASRIGPIPAHAGIWDSDWKAGDKPSWIKQDGFNPNL